MSKNHSKKELRIIYRSLRREVSPEYATLSAEIIKNGCIKLLANYTIIAAYSPIDGEISVIPLVSELINIGKTILKPSSGLDYTFENWDGTQSNIEPQALIIPLVAFDSHMNRLGFGKGWYDRVLLSLHKNVFKLGVAYELQHTKESLPHDTHDQTLDMVITEKAHRTASPCIPCI